MIIDITANYFDITTDDIIGRKRTAKVALARQIAMYLSNKYTDNTLVSLGKIHFKGKDHSTISNGCRLIAQ
ncbi:MAG: helix-turn-helix domain-containing protein, partial [Lachnospirales bacterium]